MGVREFDMEIGKMLAARTPRAIRITGMEWAPRCLYYTLQCLCGFLFTCPTGSERAECPNCGYSARIHTLRRDWEALDLSEVVARRMAAIKASIDSQAETRGRMMEAKRG